MRSSGAGSSLTMVSNCMSPPTPVATVGRNTVAYSAAPRRGWRNKAIAPYVLKRKRDTGTRPVSRNSQRSVRGRLLQVQRHEAQLALGVGDEQQRRAAALGLELVDPLLHILGGADHLLGDLYDHVADAEALLGRRRARLHRRDDHALDAVLDLVAPAEIVAQIGEVEAERLLDHRLVVLRVGLGGGRRLRLLAVLEPAEL